MTPSTWWNSAKWKVSCKSLAGCCCGTNKVSKFQKPVSTYWLDGISEKPKEKKICLNSSRTLFNGCKAPESGATPSELKLYGLKLACSQEPLITISLVMSVSNFSIFKENSGPLETENERILETVTNLRFFKSVIFLASVKVPCSICFNSLAVSSAGKLAASIFSFKINSSPFLEIQPFLKALP
ncbi:hypothetical protein WICPIJ_006474 [Wickerhamomyces pijperi]|uniref:Uncharacterized protein n=1 Tax=Wickerhamomyces pijperi TaxID=599730 RepID=A0A9P8Q1N6_WICPI|nr:hypothetical protein WICPIJ_006474 [Wickerhamomyces pijperi]